jgi:hypothetical protein
MQFFELGEIYAIARSVSDPLHRSEVGEGADGGDRVRGDLTVLGLNFEARWLCKRRSSQGSLDRMFASECQTAGFSRLRAEPGSLGFHADSRRFED